MIKLFNNMFKKSETEYFIELKCPGMLAQVFSDTDYMSGARQTRLDRRLSGLLELVAETSFHYRWHLYIHGKI